MSSEAPIPMVNLSPADRIQDTVEPESPQASHPSNLDQNDPPSESTFRASSADRYVRQPGDSLPADRDSSSRRDESIEIQRKTLFLTYVQTWIMGLGLVNWVQVIIGIILGVYAFKGAQWVMYNAYYQSCIDSTKVPGRGVTKQCNDTLDRGPPPPPEHKRDVVQIAFSTDEIVLGSTTEIVPWVAHCFWFAFNMARRYMQTAWSQAPSEALASMYQLLFKFVTGCLILGLYAEALFTPVLTIALMAMIYSYEILFRALRHQISVSASYQPIGGIGATIATLDSVLVIAEGGRDWNSVPLSIGAITESSEFSESSESINSSAVWSHDARPYEQEEDTVYLGAHLARMAEITAHNLLAAASTPSDLNSDLAHDGSELTAGNSTVATGLNLASQDGTVTRRRQGVADSNADSFNTLLTQFNELQQQKLTEDLELKNKALAFWNPLEALESMRDLN